MYLKYLPQGSAGIIIPTKNIELIISTINNIPDPRLIVTYNVTDASNSTKLFNYGSSSRTATLLFDNVLVDGVEVPILDLDTVEGKYQLSVGEHTVKYTLKDATCISGYSFSQCLSLARVIIPNSVISIGYNAFMGCSGLTNIIIPDSVTSIGNSAFYNCSSLTNTAIPNSVTSIGEAAFYYCTGLTSITIPSSVTSIDNSAFMGCSSLSSVTIPDSVTSIGNSAFGGCTNLANMVVDNNNTVYDSRGNCNAIVETSTNTLICGCKNTVIPNSVTSIRNLAFYNCSGLTNIVIPSGVTGIGDGAFKGCISLSSVTIPNNVTNISGNVFYGCSNLTSIEIPNSVTSIGLDAFSNTPWWSTYAADTTHHYGNIIYINDVAYKAVATNITTCTFKEGTVSIGGNAFYYCSSLTSVTIPNSVISIGDGAFVSCSGLTGIILPNSVTSIGGGIFSNCTSLTSVTIGSSVTSIGQGIFYNCSSLTTITSHIMEAPSVNGGTFAGIKANGTLYVPVGSSGYETWMNNQGNLGTYNWTKVEQGEVTPSPTPTTTLTLAETSVGTSVIVTNSGKLLVGSGLGSDLYLRNDNGQIRLTNYADNDTLGGWSYAQEHGVEDTVFISANNVITFEVGGVTYTLSNNSIEPEVT